MTRPRHRPDSHRHAREPFYVRCATTANITIATALNAGDTIDGIVLAAGDRVLVKDQTAGAENGIYVAGATPARSYDMDSGTEVLGALVLVLAGTVNAGKLFRATNATAPTLGTTAITFAQGTVGEHLLDDLADVSSASATEGQVIRLRGATWMPEDLDPHAHAVGEPFVGDAAQTVFYLANEAEPDSVAAYNPAGARVAITHDATELDKVTFTAAPAAGTGWLDYVLSVD